MMDLDRKKPETAEQIIMFDESLSMKLEDVELSDDEGPGKPFYADGKAGVVEQDAYTPDVMDNYLNSDFCCQMGTMDLVSACIIKRAKCKDRNPIGLHHKNPLFDTRECIMEFPDCTVLEVLYVLEECLG
jgi:hypothetical protein